MQGYESGAFSTAIQSFFQISNGESNADYPDLLATELSEFDFDLENFEMSNHSGVYNWNSSSEMWNFQSNNDNKLVFNFPFTSNGTANNTTITIDNYEVEQFNLVSETLFYPKKMVASIEKDNNEIFNIDLDNVAYRSNGEVVSPTSFELEIITEPMTHLFVLSETSTSQFEFDYSSHNDNSCTTTFSIDASTTVNDFAFMEEIEDFADVSGKIGHGDLEIRFGAQVDNLSSINEPTATQINQLVEAKVYLNNNEIGELEFSDANDTEIIYIVFNDDSREDVTNYVNDELAEQLEAIFSNYTD